MKRRTLFVCLALCVMTALWTVLPAKALEPEEELPVISSAPEESEESAVPEEPEENAAPEMLEEAAVPEEDAAEPVPQAAGATSGTCGANLTWALESDGTLRISGTGAMDDYAGSASMPWYNCRGQVKAVVIGDGVTSIGNNAFINCASILRVTIPDSIERIGSKAFSNCNLLTNIALPGAVASIDYSAFSNCTGLTSLTIPASVTKMGSGVFEGCTGLTSAGPAGGEYHIQFGWTDTIPNEAFCRHDSLVRAVIPGSITAIGASAFSSCKSLSDITFPQKAITDIGQNAFRGCSSLTDLEIPHGVTTIGSQAFSECGLTSLTFPATVTNIGNWMFYDCSSLTNVVIANGVTKVGEGMFSRCTALSSVTLPASVTKIGSDAFSGCSGLTGLTVPASVTSIGSPAFKGCSALTSAGPIGGGYDYEFGWTENIPAYAFSGCGGLTSVKLPDGISSIGNYAFNGCAKLSSLTVPASVTRVGTDVFFGCSALTSAGPIGGGYNYEFGWTEKIPSLAFCYCESLTSVKLPNGVTSIGGSAFNKCAKLSSLTVPASVTRISADAFKGCSGLTSAGPIGGGYNYEFGWTNQIPDLAFWECRGLTSVKLPNGVTSIGGSAFYNCAKLSKLTVPASVTSVASYAFKGCSALTSAGPIGGGYNYEFGWTGQIPDRAFLYCENLTNVKLPDGITSIGNYAFAECGKLTSAKLPNGVISIGNNAFNNCTELTSLTVPASVASIGADAFNGCSGLTSAGPIGGGYSYEFGWKAQIPDNAFSYCEDLTRAELPDGVTGIGSKAFYDCAKLTSLTVPASVTDIAYNTFDGCTSLTSAGPIGGGYGYEFGWKVQIPDNAFYGCTGLTSVKLPNGVAGIGNKALYNCTKLTSLTVPASVTSIGTDVFTGCTGLTSAGPIGLGYSYSFGWTDSIPDNAFSECKSLVRVRFPAGITSIGQKAFYNCSSLTDVTIPAGVTSIRRGTFQYCYSLTSVTIPASVTSMDTNAFVVSKLTDIYYTGSEEQWNAIEKFSAGIPDAAAIHYNQSGGTGSTVTPEIPADAKRDVIFMGSVTWNEEQQSYIIRTSNNSLGGGWKVTGETVLEGASSPDELLDRYMLVEYIDETSPGSVSFGPDKVLRMRPVKTVIVSESSAEQTNRRHLSHTVDGEKVGSSPDLEAGTGKLEEWNGRLAVIDGRDYYVCVDTVASLPPAGTTVGFSKVKGTSVIVELSARKYDTETGTLTSYDRSEGTAVIGSQTYAVNTFEYEADLTDFVGKEVFFLLANDEIVHMDALERARYSLNIRMKNLDSSSSRITYEHGQFSRSSFRYLVTLSNKQNYQYPDRYQRFYNRDTVRNAVINAGLNQPIALYTASWDNCTGLQMSGIKFLGDTLQPDESIEREITAVIASGYRPTERSDTLYQHPG